MRAFDVPEFYRSTIISRVKQTRKVSDPRKQDFSPSLLDFGAVKFVLARHFGFCFGVENAIEIAYKALHENQGKRIFLLSQMIHNPEVNADLESQGIKFLQDTEGNPLIPIESLKPEDVVLIPAFGTTLELEKRLEALGVDIETYNTTCPFVEKVWNRSAKLANERYTIVIHGKPEHEETRATFSHAAKSGHALVVKNMKEAERLCDYIQGKKPIEAFWEDFKGRTSDGFDPAQDLKRVGVVNQTTMLASETQAISDKIKQAVSSVIADDKAFANTRDTLCYATNDNQQATRSALEVEGLDMAIVVGGYNSSNTSHLVELCESVVPTFFVRNEKEFASDGQLNHFDWRTGIHHQTMNPWPEHEGDQAPVILLTSGASCPDSTVDRVMHEILQRYPGSKNVEDVLIDFEQRMEQNPQD
ncbi:MAG: 4-hydroxy-3-methylbut-2-enyl diphosphate reductase [Bacteroidetes bacterium]|nr:4-hydroxy-3-methylbut-2-enyl diphosphate reductase [Bacteroidota bacterium]MDA1335814.1 4-hydroxy-3-methylbut-2-enyl diphosphate reductase [Bacteroidota bacterium]